MEQHKVRTYILYALGEILLVMIGILLALQVNNWNEERIETEFQDKMISRLVEEFKSNREELVVDIERLQRIIEAIEQTIVYIDEHTDRDFADLDILNMVSTTLRDPTWNPSSFVLADLKSNGRISSLNNNELIDLIFSWERFYENVLEYQVAFVEVNNRYTRHMTELGIMVNVVKQTGFTNSQSAVDIDTILKQDKLVYYEIHRKLIQALLLKEQYELSKERLDEIIEVAD